MENISINITIICRNCGNSTSLNLKTNSDGALSLDETLEMNKSFSEKQYHPDETSIQCLQCNRKVDFTL